MINHLEFLALSLLSHDLSIPETQWVNWLSHLQAYHVASSQYPAPIRRPSITDTTTLVRNLIDNLIGLKGKWGTDEYGVPIVPQPVFSELLVKDKESQEAAFSAEAFDIDLDEDGPLRQEYVPRRRSSQRNSYNRYISDATHSDPLVSRTPPELPPPAAWSPNADPPIARDVGKRSSYIAVRPIEPVISHERTRSAETCKQPWWVEEQERMVNKPMTGNYVHSFNANAMPVVEHNLAAAAGPFHHARRQTQPVAEQFRANYFGAVAPSADSDYPSGFSSYPCGRNKHYTSVSISNVDSFHFRPQYLRA